jgi:hypothetical protein
MCELGYGDRVILSPRPQSERNLAATVWPIGVNLTLFLEIVAESTTRSGFS